MEKGCGDGRGRELVLVLSFANQNGEKNMEKPWKNHGKTWKTMEQQWKKHGQNHGKPTN
jgi:hypothetical protein